MASNLMGLAFVPYYKHLMNLLETNAELKKTSTGIFKQLVWAVGVGFVGGVVGVMGGTLGTLVGIIGGAVIGYCKSDEYSSMVTVLKNLTDSEKKELVKKVQELVGSTTSDALTAFIRSPDKRELLLNVVRKFKK